VLARLLFRVSPTLATTDALDPAVMLIVAVGRLVAAAPPNLSGFVSR
jgi:hypothetical protein